MTRQAPPEAPSIAVETIENPHAPPTETEDGASPYDHPDFIANRERGVAEQIEGWKKDWKLRIDTITYATDLSRSEAMQYLQLLQVGAMRGVLQGFQAMWNGEEFQEKRQKEHELTLMQHAVARLQLNIKEDGEPAGDIVKPPGWSIR